MEAIDTSDTATIDDAGAKPARIVVQSSIVLAIVAGCLLLRARPELCVTAAAIFIAAAISARFCFRVTSALLLFLAYTSTAILFAALHAFPAGSPWLIAAAGMVVGGLPWKSWSSPLRWRWPLIMWLVGVSISWPIVALREMDFNLAAPPEATGAVVVGAVTTLCTGLWLDAALSWNLRTIERYVAMPLATGIFVSAAAVFYQAFVDITWLSTEPWIALRRAPGLMADANPMAVAAAIWAPLAGFVLARARAAGTVVISAAILWPAAWLTGSRSAILLVAAGAVGLIGGAVVQYVTPKRRLLIAAAAAIVIAGVAGALFWRSPDTGPIARLTQTLPLDRPGALAYEVLWRRDGYGLAAARAIREQPLSGVGIGAFNFLSTYYYRLEGGPFILQDNAQNLWRQALAERGVLAFVAVLALTVAVMRLLWQRPQGVPLLYAWCLKATLTGLGLALVFGLPIQNPAIAITAASLVAWIRATGASEHGRRPMRKALVALVWMLAFAGVAADAWAARHDLRPAWRASRVGDLYVYGFGDIESGPNGVTGRPVTRHGVMAIRVGGERFALRCWSRGNSPQRLRVWADRRLVIDEVLPAGVIIERLVDTPHDRPGMMLEFETESPGVGMTGEFVGR